MNPLKHLIDVAARDTTPIIRWASPGGFDAEIDLAARIMPELSTAEGREHAWRIYRNTALLAHLLREWWPQYEINVIRSWIFKASQSRDVRPFALADAAGLAEGFETLPEFAASLALDGVVAALEHWMGDHYKEFVPNAEDLDWSLEHGEKTWSARCIVGVDFDQSAYIYALVKNRLDGRKPETKAKRKASADKRKAASTNPSKATPTKMKWNLTSLIKIGWVPCGFWAMTDNEIALRLGHGTEAAVDRVRRDISDVEFSNSHRPEHEAFLPAQ